MTEHLYTPAGMRSQGGTSRFKGKDAAVTALLEAAVRAGVDQEYDHGTVELSEQGYGGTGYYDNEYYWEEVTESNMTLTLSNHGEISIDRKKEMVPPDFYDGRDPEEESFEPTGNAGVEADKQSAKKMI